MADVYDLTKRRKSARPADRVTHIARADLVPLAALYYLYIKNKPASAQSLITAFATQGMYTPAIELTEEQYTLFKAATPYIVDIIGATYEAYLKKTTEY